MDRQQPGMTLLKRDLTCNADQPLVTIISAFYNALADFEQTYRCVMNQTFPWFEWIIVNDGSTDDAQVETLKRFVASDARIRLVEQKNGGLAQARNTAIAHAKADIIIPLDCDDLISPTYIEMVWWALAHHTKAAWAYTDTIGFGSQDYVWKRRFSAQEMKTNNILVATAAIRKSTMLEYGAYDTVSKHFFEDWALWLKMMGGGNFPVHLSESAFWYRRSDDGELTNAGRNEEQMPYLNQLAQKVDDNLKAVEYPRAAQKHFLPPKRSTFDRKVYNSHKKTRLLLILPWLEVGGADLFNLELVARLDPMCYDITIVTTLPGENAIRDRFEKVTPEVYALANFMDADQYPEFVSYLINTRDIDAIMVSNSSHGYGMTPWLRMQYPQVPIFDYVHMEEWYWRNGGYARQSAYLGDVLERTCVCNGSTRRVMTDIFHRDPDTVETVYIGVDEQKFSAAGVDTAGVYSKCGISKDQPMVLFPCRLNAQKRPYMMLEIAREVRKKVPNVVFLVVGDGAEKEGMEAAIREMKLEKTVRMIGFEADLRPYYKAADVTLICSLKEGLTLTAYESCAMGTPVVSSDVGGQGEMIDDQVGAIIPLMQSEAEHLGVRTCNPEEVKRYVTALTELLLHQDVRERKGIACRKRIEERFTIHHMVERMDEVIQQLMHSEEKQKARVEKAAQLQKNERLTDEFYTMLTEYEDMDTMQWLCAKLVSEPSQPQSILANQANIEGEVRILSPAMARFLDRLMFVSNKTWFGRTSKRIYRGLKRQVRKIIK